MRGCRGGRCTLGATGWRVLQPRLAAIIGLRSRRGELNQSCSWRSTAELQRSAVAALTVQEPCSSLQKPGMLTFSFWQSHTQESALKVPCGGPRRQAGLVEASVNTELPTIPGPGREPAVTQQRPKYVAVSTALACSSTHTTRLPGPMPLPQQQLQQSAVPRSLT